MSRLGRQILRILIEEYGPDEFIRRIADPAWFQSLGTVLAFDWNASGLTTVLTAALKDAIRGQEEDFGVFICGGKGKTSLKTPEEIRQWGERISLPETSVRSLVYNSRMSAKVDSALIQDGFQLYHHAFFFSRTGAWTVVQQGMHTGLGAARRYHWYSANVKDLVNEPHSGISSDRVLPAVLNLVAQESEKTRSISTDLIRAGYRHVMREIQILRKHCTPLSKRVVVGTPQGTMSLLKLENREFHTHPVVHENFSKSKYLERIMAKVTGLKPKTYEEFLSIEGVGPKTVRALALVAEVIYGAPPSYEDPARYGFSFGGKDATPYPIDRPTYDDAILMLERAVTRSALAPDEKRRALNRLHGSCRP
jgi:hypothetical protein